jgi:acetyl esterase/lipase
MIAKSIDIWDGIDYNYKKDGFVPTLDTYVLKGDKKRPAVLVCPGGGYSHTSQREAEAIAIQFNAVGYHSFVLYYSVAPRKHPQPLLDISRAMCIIRQNAENFHLLSDQIAVCGFSAGGHLAGSLGVHWNQAYLLEQEGIVKGLNKPNALILSYPVITEGEFAHKGSFENLLGLDATQAQRDEFSLEKQVGEQTPKTFIWHTFADQTVPVENSLLFANALRQNNIPFELHIYPDGGHGLSLGTEETEKVQPGVETWMQLCTYWLKREFAK